MKVPKPNNILTRYLNPDQEEQLLSHLPKKYQPVVITALNTGCRQGELMRLEWCDVDWYTGQLTIRETKAGDPRRVPINSIVQGLLTFLQKTSIVAPETKIFPLDVHYLRRAFDRAVQTTDLHPFRFHDLRHTFASRLAMQGANDRTLMALGGWKRPDMLSRYAHLSPTHLWGAVENLTNLGGKNR